MKLKFLSIILIAAGAVFVWCASAQESFVRKKIRPGFFIPEEEFSRPQKKLPTPQYTKGQDETVKVAQPESVEDTKTNDISAAISQARKDKADIAPIVGIDNYKSEPEYQLKYQDYMKDLGEVSKGRKMPDNPKLQSDLAKMNSEERILVDKKFNAERSPQKDFEKALVNGGGN